MDEEPSVQPVMQLDLQIEHAALVAPCLNFVHTYPVSFCHA